MNEFVRGPENMVVVCNVHVKWLYSFSLTFFLFFFSIYFRLLDVLTLLSKKLGSYKVTLDCKDKMIPFYNTFGFTKEEGNNFLQQRFKD